MKKAATHTPGPWQVMPEEMGKHYLRIRGTQLGDRYKIANVLAVYGVPIDAHEAAAVRANAHLICAAPDLLEALEEILKCEIARRDDLATLSKKPGSIYEFSDKRVKMAQAAIAKAKGK